MMSKKCKNGLCALLLILVAGVACQSVKQNVEGDKPRMFFRLNIEHTISDKVWGDLLNNLQEHPGCCDEIWFSTGITFPQMEVHEQHVEKLKLAKQELAELGISSSLQIQMTLGHSDPVGDPGDWSAKDWTGFTGSTGVECKYCSCPRQPGLLEYMRDMTRIYAVIEPRILWIDDDLRYDNHKPATNGSRLGCWCDTCIAEFSTEQGREWTRESLNEAMATDKELAREWQLFSIESLKKIAHIIAEEAHAIAPNTQMGYQKTFYTSDTLVVSTILKELADVSGRKVAYRPGGSAYYDKYQPTSQIIKSMDAARFMNLLGNPDYVDSWCPEVESYPRHYGSRTGQSVLLEGFAALAYGMDAVSVFVLDRGKELPEVQARSMFLPLAEGSDVLKAYARANDGTQAVGYRANVNNQILFDFAISGIPVLPGVGKELGVIDEKDRKSLNIYGRPSHDVQALRDKLSKDVEMPVVCQSAFVGMVMPRIDAEEELRTLGVINCRIDSQGPIRFKLNAASEDCQEVVWRELRKDPIRLEVIHENGGSYVEIPEIAAWNAGFLDFQ